MIVIIKVLISCQNGNKESQIFQENKIDFTVELSQLNGDWKLLKVNDTLFSVEDVYSTNYGGQPVITIDTDNNKIGGFTGCNAWGTILDIQNNSFVLDDPIEMNEQGCEGSWESEFLNFLRNNKKFVIFEDNLKLTSKNNKTMTFERVE